MRQLAAFPLIPAFVPVAMRIMKVMLRTYDKRAELSAFLMLVMVLAIGTLAKFDAAALLFHHGH
jgi:hypothetical protein